jgi:O-antigen/teichoic acid export membrane protein
MNGNLRTKVIHSFFWVFIDSFGQRIFQFIIGIILARLLLPEEFGLIGMIAVFITFSQLFIDSGFSFALIRKKEVTRIEYETVFWFNTSASLFFFIILWVTSPYIAEFYNQPDLTNIVKAVSISLLINACGSIQNIGLRRDLKFKELTIAGFFSKVISGVVAIYMALRGLGVWSLVIQQLLNNLLRVSILFFYNRLLPHLRFSFKTFKELFSFSSKLLYGGMVNSIVSNIYPLVIGKYFSVSEVGFFNKANSMQGFPVLLFTGIVQQVSLPTFSKIQDDDLRFKNAYKSAIQLSFFTILLPLVLIVASAKPLVVVLLTEKWLPAAGMLQILAIGGMFYPLSALNVNIIGIKGRSDLVMYLQFSKDALTIAGVIIGVFFGIKGLVISYTVTSIVAYFFNAFFANKVMTYPISEQLIDIFPFSLLAIITMLVVILLGSITENLFFKLLIIWGSGIFIYTGLAFVLKFQVLSEIRRIIKELINMKK